MSYPVDNRLCQSSFYIPTQSPVQYPQRWVRLSWVNYGIKDCGKHQLKLMLSPKNYEKSITASVPWRRITIVPCIVKSVRCSLLTCTTLALNTFLITSLNLMWATANSNTFMFINEARCSLTTIVLELIPLFSKFSRTWNVYLWRLNQLLSCMYPFVAQFFCILTVIFHDIARHTCKHTHHNIIQLFHTFCCILNF